MLNACAMSPMLRRAVLQAPLNPPTSATMREGPLNSVYNFAPTIFDADCCCLAHMTSRPMTTTTMCYNLSMNPLSSKKLNDELNIRIFYSPFLLYSKKNN